MFLQYTHEVKKKRWKFGEFLFWAEVGSVG